MKKLDDIPKKDIFDVPDGYFEKLPGVIQSRVAAPQRQTRMAPRWALQYALPIVVLLALGIYWFRGDGPQPTTAEFMLASIPTDELVAYLHDTDISTEELLETATLDTDDAGQIEDEVYGFDLSDEELDLWMEEADTNNL